MITIANVMIAILMLHPVSVIPLFASEVRRDARLVVEASEANEGWRWRLYRNLHAETRGRQGREGDFEHALGCDSLLGFLSCRHFLLQGS